MMISAVVALLIGIFYQGFELTDGIRAFYDGFNLEMVESARTGFQAANAGEDAMTLLNRGGLSSMLKSFILL